MHLDRTRKVIVSKEDTDKGHVLLEGPLHRWLKASLPEQLSSSESGIADGLDKLIAPIGDPSDKSTWQPGDDDKQVAWLIYTELRSRVTTQDLPYSDGQDAAALESVYTLFKTTRDAVNKQGPNCQIVAHIAFCMLNKVVRPFTAKWHLRNVSGKLVNNDERNEFRRELSTLKTKLRLFEVCFARISGQIGGTETQPSSIKLLDDLNPKDPLLRQELANLSEDMLKAEVEEIEKRRSVFHVQDKEADYVNLNGLAISGGGIRSATFALGVCDRLAMTGIFKQFDYISSVSGGAYLGSLITSRLSHKAENRILDYIPFDHGNELARDSEGDQQQSPNSVVSHLRDNGRYLLRNRWRALELWSFGIGVNAALIFSLALVTSSFVFLVDFIFHKPGSGWLKYSALLLGSGCASAICVYLAEISWSNRSTSEKNNLIQHTFTSIGFFFLIVLLFSIFSWLIKEFDWKNLEIPYVEDVAFAYGAQLKIGIAALLCLVIAGIKGKNHTVAKALLFLATLLAAAFLLSIVKSVAKMDFITKNFSWVLPPSALLLWGLSKLNINSASFNNYYRGGLAEAYLQTRPGEHKDAALSDQHQEVPYHLIGAALNIPSSSSYRMNERNADFFLFSPKFCGSKAIGYHATKKPPFNELQKSTAMAVSGAAVSPLAGRNTTYGLTPWLAILNIRLGLWFCNPSTKNKNRTKNTRPTPFLLWRELVGYASEKSSHINVSDGGHIENLAVYELLRRRCLTIICIDGEADPKMEYDGLLRLIQLAKVDLDVDIEIDLDSLKPRENGFSYSHFAMAKITYPLADKHSTEKCNNVGYMLYIKSSLTGNEQPYILDYKRKQPDFPHQSTSDQFFSEEQFESYRALGYHVAEDLLTDLNLDGELYSPADNANIDIKTMMQRPGGMQLLFAHLSKKLRGD